MVLTKAIIKIDSYCNNNCKFCHYGNQTKKFDSLEKINSKLILAKKYKIEQILLSGGECTIHPQFVEILKLIKEHGIKSGIISNLRMFSSQKFTDEVFRIKNTDYIYASLHSSNEQVHNWLTGAESWKQTLKGIYNIVKDEAPKEVTVNQVITNENVNHMIEYIDFLLRHFGNEIKNNILKVKFSLPVIEGNFEKNPKNKPSLNNVEVEINEVFRYGVRKGFKIYYDNIPKCLVDKKFRENVDDFSTNRIKMMSEIDENDFFPKSEGERVKTPACKKCDLKCAGVDISYKNEFNEIKGVS